MILPEWEIEEALIWNPKLIEIPGCIENLKFVERQKYLPKGGIFIDLLFKQGESYVIVEIKNQLIQEPEVITNQILRYKRELMELLHSDSSKIKCLLVSPKGFSPEIERICKRYDVFIKQLNEKEIINSIPTQGKKYILKFPLEEEQIIILRILQRRKNLKSYVNVFSYLLGDKESNLSDEIKSIKKWIKNGTHDHYSKKHIAKLFKKISKTAPICAHEIETDSNGQLKGNDKMWFWLFYSVLDRRANAATFHKAADVLKKKGLFNPKQINNLINKYGESKTINKIREILEDASFPLIMDTIYGFNSFPKSIIDAAKFIASFDYDFINLYNHYKEKARGDLNKAYKLIYNDIKNQIYGAGTRITGQIIRGLVLKGPWDLPLTDNKLLEYCRYNAYFAGKQRLSLISNEKNYHKELGEYADNFLNGNRGIVSHVLWYVRRRYCYRTPHCSECLFAGYCGYFAKKQFFVLDSL